MQLYLVAMIDGNRCLDQRGKKTDKRLAYDMNVQVLPGCQVEYNIQTEIWCEQSSDLSLLLIRRDFQSNFTICSIPLRATCLDLSSTRKVQEQVCMFHNMAPAI